MKGLFIILDGVADEPCPSLNNKTPLEAAKTPNLDWLSEKGKLDYCYTVKENFIPESHEGVLGLFGYNPLELKRGAFEAIGLGVQLKNGDLAFRCNFATIDSLEDKNILDRRAGRTLTTKEAKILATAINSNVHINEKFKFEFFPGIQHRGALVFKGGFSDNISDVKEKNGKLTLSTALDEEDESKLSSDILNQFVRKSHEILDKHPINVARAKKGLYSANILLCRGAESDKIRLKKLKGKWMALNYMPLEIGIAKTLKMDAYKFKYPKLKGIDVYNNLFSGLKLAIKNSVKMIKKNRKKQDYFYVHFKETDIPGHDNKPLEKVKMIELIDEKFFGFLRKYLRNGQSIIVTADHTTSCKAKNHTADPVPLLSYPFDGKVRKNQRFTEEWGLRGKKLLGKKVLVEKMFGQ